MMATMEMPKEATQQEGYEMADEVMSRIGGLDDVETVGAISGGMSMSFVLLRQHLQLLYFIEGKRPHPLQRPNGGADYRCHPGSGL